MCTRRYEKCGNNYPINLTSGYDTYELVFKNTLQLNDYCSWHIKLNESLRENPLTLENKGLLTLAELVIKDQNGKRIIDDSNFTKSGFQTFTISPLIKELKIFYRSVKT